MKKLIFLFVVCLLFFVGCDSSSKEENEGEEYFSYENLNYQELFLLKFLWDNQFGVVPYDWTTGIHPSKHDTTIYGHNGRIEVNSTKIDDYNFNSSSKFTNFSESDTYTFAGEIKLQTNFWEYEPDTWEFYYLNRIVNGELQISGDIAGTLVFDNTTISFSYSPGDYQRSPQKGSVYFISNKEKSDLTSKFEEYLKSYTISECDKIFEQYREQYGY